MQYLLAVTLLFIGVVESIRRNKLTVAGAVAGGFIGFSIFIGAGWTGLAFLATFFLLGTLSTTWKHNQKAKSKMAQDPDGKRNLGQVIANGGVGGLAGLLTLFFPESKMLLALMMAGAFSAALADTLSSELGTLYGKRFYNIVTFKKDEKGLDGVVSIEGSLIGFSGSMLMGGLYCTGFGWSLDFLWILLGGIIGNLVDSLLGATLERKGILKNDIVNLLNTLTGATVTALLAS